MWNQEITKLTDYVKKEEYNNKLKEIEKSIAEKASKEEIPKDYLKKEDLPKPIDTSNLVKKEQIEKFITKEDIPNLEPYALKENIPDISHLAKRSELPNLEPYIKKSELPAEKDLSEYAKKSDLEGLIHKDSVDLSKYATKQELTSKAEISEVQKRLYIDDFEKYKAEVQITYANKKDIPDISHLAEKEDLPDFNTLATKAELELKASIADMAKKVSIEDMEKYKSAVEESLKSKLNKSETYTRQEVKDCYVKKEAHQKDLEKKIDRIDIPDFDSFAKKSDLDGLVAKDCVDLRPYVQKEELNQYAKKSDLKPHETSYCMVKLLGNFLPYDGGDWEFEYYMGNRGQWRIVYDTHNKLDKPNEYVYWTPFKGVFSIDFCYTCRRDTHLLKPHALQRIRMSGGWEFINWKYFDNSSAVHTGNDVTTVTFRDRVEFLAEANVWIKFSMQFTNRANNAKRKNWLHAVGSDGGYTPTYFSITGHKIP